MRCFLRSFSFRFESFTCSNNFLVPITTRCRQNTNNKKFPFSIIVGPSVLLTNKDDNDDDDNDIEITEHAIIGNKRPINEIIHTNSSSKRTKYNSTETTHICNKCNLNLWNGTSQDIEKIHTHFCYIIKKEDRRTNLMVLCLYMY